MHKYLLRRCSNCFSFDGTSFAIALARFPFGRGQVPFQMLCGGAFGSICSSMSSSSEMCSSLSEFVGLVGGDSSVMLMFVVIFVSLLCLFLHFLSSFSPLRCCIPLSTANDHCCQPPLCLSTAAFCNFWLANAGCRKEVGKYSFTPSFRHLLLYVSFHLFK